MTAMQGCPWAAETSTLRATGNLPTNPPESPADPFVTEAEENSGSPYFRGGRGQARHNLRVAVSAKADSTPMSGLAHPPRSR
jgi:hypothetical protein